MTAFEITIIVLLVIIAIAVIYRMIILKQTISYNQMVMDENIRKMDEGLDERLDNLTNIVKSKLVAIVNYTYETKLSAREVHDIVDKMHRNLCADIADKMVNKMYPVNEGEPLDAAFEPDYKLKKDIECKLNGFAAAVLDAECCPKEIVDFWLERICDAAHKYIKQLKIDWDKLSKEQQDEFLKRLIMPNYDNPFQPPFNPTCETTNNNE